MKGFNMKNLNILLVTTIITPSINSRETNSLQQNINQTQSFNIKQFVQYYFHSSEIISDFYRKQKFNPVWVDQYHLLPQAQKFISYLKNVDKEGLFPEDYHYYHLKHLIIKKNMSPSPTIKSHILSKIELLLTDAFFVYISDISQGKFNYKTNSSNLLRQRVITDNSLDYIQFLNRGLSNNNLLQMLENIKPQFIKYQKLLKSLSKYEKIQNDGGWNRITINETIKPGDRNNEVKLIRERLKNEPIQITDLCTEDEYYFDENLEKAVKNFQKRHGISQSGTINLQTIYALNIPVEQIVTKIKLNLDRLRWLPFEINSRFIFVNIPDYKVKIYENEKVIKEMRAVVGRINRQTPVFEDEIVSLVFNPVWRIPESIIIRDYLPRLKNDRGILFEEKIRIYEVENNRYQEINPVQIDWNKIDKDKFDYHLWQDPGPENYLGNVIFRGEDHNPESIYLHDSPERHLFYERNRTFSSGCVRIKKALDLAYYLLNLKDEWNRERINNLIKNNTETKIALQTSIPLYILYLTAWVDENNQLNLRNDIYERDEQIISYFE